MPASYLENALLKLARQIVAFDEASLMDLWERYAESVRHFEPTRRWEEAALVFGVIQAVRMKNQLFNYNLAASRAPAPGPPPGLDMLGLTAPAASQATAPGRASGGPQTGRPGGQAGPAPQKARQEEAPASRRPQPKTSVRQGKPKAGKLIPIRPDKG